MLLRVVVFASICAFALSMYNADPAKWNRHQYLVKILTKDLKSELITTCSGTLLSPNVVLTSANCFPENRKNFAAQAVIVRKNSKETLNKMMLAVKLEENLALMKIDPIRDEEFCDRPPFPSRVARLNFKPSLTDASYHPFDPKELQEMRCRIVGFATNEDVDDFATSQDVQVQEMEIRADEENLVFSEINANVTGRACWDDIGIPLECAVNEENNWVQVGVLHKLYGREVEESESNSTAVACSDVRTMQFAVFGDNSLAHAIEAVDKATVFDAQDKCF